MINDRVFTITFFRIIYEFKSAGKQRGNKKYYFNLDFGYVNLRMVGE